MRQGFTLLQISILLAVASLVAVTMLPSYQLQKGNSQSRSATDSLTKMNAVFLALRGYEESNGGKLPCPADASQPTGSNNYGVPAANPGPSTNCTGGTPAANAVDATNNIAVGMVPVRALGLPNDYALDGYGRDITYAVDTNATGCWASSPLTGKITVTDNGATANTVAALVSYGADGHGAWLPLGGASGTAVRLNAGATDTGELTNAHVNASFNPTTPLTNFVRKSQTATFNNLVVYKNPSWNINALPASVVSVSLSSITPPANGSYSTGQVLTFTVTFSAAVTVTGTPRLDLTIGGNTRYATYQSGTGTTTLTFSYTVVAGDSAPSGISMASSSIDLNGGTITSGSGCVALAFTAPSLTSVTVNGCTQSIWVVDSGNNRVQKFDCNGNYISQFGSSGSGSGNLNNPYDLAIDSSGNIWVTDYGNNREEKFNSAGTYVSQLGCASGACTTGSGNGQFSSVYGVAINSSGNILVSDGNDRVQTFNSSGAYVSQFGSGGTHNGQFGGVWGIAFDSGGNIWVVDGNGRVEKFNSAGTYKSQFGSGGTGNGQFSSPKYLAIDSSGNFWVVDEVNNRVEEFNSSNTYVGQIGCASGACTSGSGNGQFYFPWGIAIDSSGNIWVTDGGNNRVQKFSSTGTYISQFPCASGKCTASSANGQLNYPVGIAIH